VRITEIEFSVTYSVPMVNFEPSPASVDITQLARDFVTRKVAPAEKVFAEQRRASAAAGQPHAVPPVLEALKVDARSRGLWNLFLPAESGLSTVDYAPVAEVTGWYPELAPESFNCSAPDSGNMELLHMFADERQTRMFLDPLLDGSIRSAFAMTEPDVASSDASNIQTSIDIDADGITVNGRKWWITGALDPRCHFFVVMGVSDPDVEGFRRQSFVIVPRDTPGVTVERDLDYYGYQDVYGHGEVVFRNVRVPRANLLGEQGGGFAMAQARLGPGRIHHCMRAIGMAERSIALMKDRVRQRVAFGEPLAKNAVVREWVAEARISIEQLRLLVMKCAWVIDVKGAAEARNDVAAIKVAVPRGVAAIIDDAIQLHGAMGVSSDTPLAQLWAIARTMRFGDGPDQVHLRTLGRNELRVPRAS
jgi:acyl-CoA dehydrogenase